MRQANGGPAFPHHKTIINSKNQVVELWKDGMTLREYAAIKLRVPDSGTDWLDEMIRRAKRDEFAGMALQGLILNLEDGYDESKHASDAYRWADAMIRARQS